MRVVVIKRRNDDNNISLWKFAGDLLTRWSNDTIHSTHHQVVEPPSPPENDVYPARYSVAYFCNPNSDSLIEALPGTYVEGKTAEEGGKKYDGILSGKYLVQRLSATISIDTTA